MKTLIFFTLFAFQLTAQTKDTIYIEYSENKGLYKKELINKKGEYTISLGNGRGDSVVFTGYICKKFKKKQYKFSKTIDDNYDFSWNNVPVKNIGFQDQHVIIIANGRKRKEIAICVESIRQFYPTQD